MDWILSIISPTDSVHGTAWFEPNLWSIDRFLVFEMEKSEHGKAVTVSTSERIRLIDFGTRFWHLLIRFASFRYEMYRRTR
jgi:hypothetical protein